MVVGIIKKILPIALIGIGLFAAANIVARPGSASMSAKALSETLTSFGGGIGSIGSGVQSLFSGIGTGSAQLLNPLFTLKDLIYGDQAQGIVLQENALTASNTVTIDPVVNTASDQPGVTPQAPASQSALEPTFTQFGDTYNPAGSNFPTGTFGNFPSARRATSSEKSTLSALTGGLLG
jgi:hypothetical protein|tara:strand:+ start:369 stop:905 length:537 start_codon:yes stop_codon:yes gene_type:complete